ncbi:MAG: DUF2339 domain-containing protein, partial [Acidobacteriota bacterium]
MNVFLFLGLAVLFILFLTKTNEINRQLSVFRRRILTLENRLAELAEKLNKTRVGDTAPPETAEVETKSAAPEPKPEKPPEETVAPVPTPPVHKDVSAAISPKPPEEIPPIPGPETTSGRKAPSSQRPFPKPPTISPSSWKLPKFDWESLVGVKLFSWIAGVALLLAAIFFLQYSIKEGWLTPPVQMAIGILVGIGLLVLCELKAAVKYPVTANALDASAIAILFSTFYAGNVRWELIGVIPSFVFMALVMAVAVLLSIRRNSIFIALLGLIGAFATPALLSKADEPISLFSYILLLNAGLAWVSTKKKWPLLTTMTLIFTFLYQWGWVIKFLTANQLP